MKKNILFFALVFGFLSLMAFTYLSSDTPIYKVKNQSITFQSNPLFEGGFMKTKNFDPNELLYKIESRFIATIPITKLHMAKSIVDILPPKATANIISYQDARVSLLDDHVETERRAYSEDDILTASQINLIQSIDKSANIYIKADYKTSESGSFGFGADYLTYFISVVPDQQAEYEDGYETLIQYLKDNSKEAVSIITKGGLKPGKVQFTVGKDGSVSDVELNSTSGYDSVDEVLINLMQNAPGKWKPASKSDGTLMDQELVFFFGLMGC